MYILRLKHQIKDGLVLLNTKAKISMPGLKKGFTSTPLLAVQGKQSKSVQQQAALAALRWLSGQFMALTFPRRSWELDLEAEPSPSVGLWIQAPSNWGKFGLGPSSTLIQQFYSLAWKEGWTHEQSCAAELIYCVPITHTWAGRQQPCTDAFIRASVSLCLFWGRDALSSLSSSILWLFKELHRQAVKGIGMGQTKNQRKLKSVQGWNNTRKCNVWFWCLKIVEFSVCVCVLLGGKFLFVCMTLIAGSSSAPKVSPSGTPEGRNLCTT